MGAVAVVDTDGRLVVDAAVTREAGLRPGDTVSLEKFAETPEQRQRRLRVVPEAVEVKTVDPEASVLEKWRGIGNPGLPTGRQALIQYFRDVRGHEPVE